MNSSNDSVEVLLPFFPLLLLGVVNMEIWHVNILGECCGIDSLVLLIEGKESSQLCLLTTLKGSLLSVFFKKHLLLILQVYSQCHNSWVPICNRECSHMPESLSRADTPHVNIVLNLVSG